jgi:hypothetical protein
MPIPTDVAAIQRYMGTVNYLSRFMPRLSDVAAPLRKLTHKDCPWLWTDAHDQAITQIKEIISHDPVLRYYDPQLELTLQCDASGYGLGSCLMQLDQPIAVNSDLANTTIFK